MDYYEIYKYWNDLIWIKPSWQGIRENADIFRYIIFYNIEERSHEQEISLNDARQDATTTIFFLADNKLIVMTGS